MRAKKLCLTASIVGLNLLSGIVTLPVLANGTQCAAESLPGSLPSTISVNLTFRNRSAQTVKLYWRNLSGQRVLYTTIAPNTSYTQATFVTHPWVITDEQDNCYSVFYPDGQSRTVFLF